MDIHDNTQAIRTFLHVFFLVAANLLSLVFGVIFMLFFKELLHNLLQPGIALACNIFVYIVVFKLMASVEKNMMHIHNFSMLLTMLISSIVLFPVVFIPLQYLISGNWQPIETAMKVWPFLLIANGLCLLINFYFFSKKSG